MLETSADDSFSVQPLAGYLEQVQGSMNATPNAHLSATPPTNLMATSKPSAPPTSSSLPLDKPPPPSHGAVAAGGGGGPANPYRIGTGIGSRKPAYGASGIASFSGTTSFAPPTSQSLTQQPPMMVPSQPMTSSSIQPQAPPTSVTGGPGPSLYESGPPLGSVHPTNVHVQSGPPAHVIEPQLSGGGWDHTSQPVRYHWFYLRSGEKYWIPFSLIDSYRLEQALSQHQNASEEVCVCVWREREKTLEKNMST